ncbi:MAG TPA: hypothetical protein VGD80_20805 [Kofleriaceae bacterium]
MIKSKKKLALRTETILHIGKHQLRAVAGGQTLATCSELCTEDICPDTQFIHGCNSNTIHC